MRASNLVPRMFIAPSVNPFKAFLVAQFVKNLPAIQETWLKSWIRNIPWRRRWQPTPVFLPEKFHAQRNLAGYIVHGVARVRHDLVATPPPLPFC